MNRISAQIIADSISPQGDRITTYILKYPRIIHAELMTHRMFSRNSASSRAIPFEKMIKMVEEEPFIPIAWQKEHKGMQGTEYITDKDLIDMAKATWLFARDEAVSHAIGLHNQGITKQLCNRLLEPYMYHTVLVTATEWSNFFDLRCPKYECSYYPSNRPEATEPTECTFKSKKDWIKVKEDGISSYKYIKDADWYNVNTSQAEIHIQDLAEKMWDAYNQSKPKELKEGEWHIPFGDKFDWDEILKSTVPTEDSNLLIKIATARCARLSYMTFDGDIDYEKDIKLHDQLLENKHYSPFEHCARVMTGDEYMEMVKGTRTINNRQSWRNNPSNGWCNNFKGFIPYRYLIENKL